MGGTLQHEYKEYKEYYPNGQIKNLYFYKDKKREGEYRYWYNNGQLWCHAFYKDGKVEGEYRSWYDNSQIGSYTFYRNGIQEGENKCWFKNNGYLWCYDFYRDGKPLCNINLRIKFSISNFKKRWKNHVRKRMINMLSLYLIRDLAELTSKWII